MSRCFPYPPPGFEPKLKNDHVDLSHKEKHKDKKHKKEKKDKREKEEKREKDKHHSKEKHRDNSKDEEKKERKEKHKHKKREKERDKEPDKDKNRALPVLLPVPTEKTPERVFSEHSKRIDEGSQAGPPNHFVERRVSGTSSHGASEKKPVPVSIQPSVPSVHRKSNDALKVGPTSQTINHRVTVVNGRRVAGTSSSSSPDEGMIAKRTVPNASNSNIMNPNSLMQRNSNGPSNQVLNLHGTGSTERRIPEAKKPVPSPLNSLQGKTIAPTNQGTNHPQLPLTGSHNRVASTERGSEAKRVAGNSMLQMQRKTDGPTFQVTNNHQAAGLTEKRVGLNHSTVSPSALVKDKEKVKVGSNLRGSEPGSVKQEEGKKEKRKERDEKKEKEKELRRLEKKQRKEREKEEKKKKKEKERDKVKEVVNSIARPSNEGLQRNIEKVEVVNSIARPSNEGLQRNIEKVGPTDGILSKKRKDGESNGFLHEDDMRAQKLVRTSPPGTPKRKHASTNGFVHENDVQSKLTKKLPPPPHLENGRTSNHPPPFPPPTIRPCSSSPSTTATNNNPANINAIIKAEVPLIKKAPELNGIVPNAKVHKKRKEEPPHPDLKYLNVVYSVPKLEEKELQPPEDDHEWLFAAKPNRNHNFDPNSTRLESGLSDRPDLVWDRAVRLDSADAFALPYVVPF